MRNQEWDIANHIRFDVVIIGGGINGACLYHHLCEQGFKVLLLDQGDFGSGTSQASAMMIWGGLLYLRNFDFATVLKLCLSRERMIGQIKNCVEPQVFRYVSNRKSHNSALITMALYFYWIMSGFRRSLPHLESRFPEQAFLDSTKFQNGLDYEEGRVLPSDARFVLSWILPHRNDRQIALNHCGVVSGNYDARNWNLNVYDSVLQKKGIIQANTVINAAGVWTDSVNKTFGIDSPYKHVFSKGVFLAISRRSEHVTPLILDCGQQNDYMSLIPWGPVSLWGPTETSIPDLTEGFRATPQDVSYLLSELNQNLAEPVMPSDIVSLRCGVRPLAVKNSYCKNRYSLDLSRKSQIVRDSEKSWISVYGGKLTACIPLAESVTKLISERISSKPFQHLPQESTPEAEMISFPGLKEKVPSPSWCKEQELCWTLEDYLRRRTNISQWIPRGGLGNEDENLLEIENISSTFSADRKMFVDYRKKIQEEFDEVVSLAACGTRSEE